MTDNIQCVFLPPDFHVNDILAVSMFVTDPLETIPVLGLVIDNKEISISQGVQVENKLSWITETIDEFREITTQTKRIAIKYKGKHYDFDLSRLIYLGPLKTANPKPNIFLLEFTSGFYCNYSDYAEDSVTFNVDSILTLDYRNVNSIKTQLEELNAAQKAFEETKQKLIQSGIDLDELAKLKVQYEESMREKRRVQHEFMLQNQRMQAATIHSQAEQDRQNAVEALKKHIQANKKKAKVPEADQETYKKLVKFRESALLELKAIFPFDTDKKTLCSLQYNQNPQSVAQFNDMRAYLGFATHYIREVSRVLGIPLQYILVPLAASSKVISRVTEKPQVIPTDFSPASVKQMAMYEKSLIDCVIHIIKTLMMDYSTCGNSIAESISVLQSIDTTALETLIPIVQN